jgi:hypothetical protein
MSKRFCQAVLAVLWLSRPGTALPSDDIVGVYQYEGPVAATLEVRHETGQYVDGVVLHARFGPVETDTFSYGAAQAESEARMVRIAFEPGAAQVIEADTLGYCGLGVEFSGRYRADG